jgi:hypothetical protein
MLELVKIAQFAIKYLMMGGEIGGLVAIALVLCDWV